MNLKISFFTCETLVLFVNFDNLDHCFCLSPVHNVFKMGCNISTVQNSSEILQFKDRL